MELGYGGQATFQPQQTQGYVLCCLCGTNILPNPSNMCVNCIRSQVDITEGIQKQVKLVDAGFIWTEPHSKRIKVKLTIQVRDIHEGIDFFYANRSHAQKFIDFLQSVVPIRFRADKQLVSHDTHNNTYNYKFTFSVEIVPLCKDDLVFLPPKMAASAGNLGPFVLVSRITNQISLVDPANMRTHTMDAPIARVSDFGKNDTVFYVRTHLGNILHPGDTVLGYDLTTAQLTGIDYDNHMSAGGRVPEIILEADRERFMQELEEDADMRARINIYKDAQGLAQGEDEEDDDDEDLPQIPLEELLDDLEGLALDPDADGEEEDPSAGQASGAGAGDMDMD
eukprot:XP_001701157.1 predicted protein [Chlamydomonas reinhardtii]